MIEFEQKFPCGSRVKVGQSNINPGMFWVFIFDPVGRRLSLIVHRSSFYYIRKILDRLESPKKWYQFWR